MCIFILQCVSASDFITQHQRQLQEEFHERIPHPVYSDSDDESLPTYPQLDVASDHSSKEKFLIRNSPLFSGQSTPNEATSSDEVVT